MSLAWSLPRNFPLSKKKKKKYLFRSHSHQLEGAWDPTIDWTVILSYIVNTQRYWEGRRIKGGCQTRKGGSKLEGLGALSYLRRPLCQSDKICSNSVIWSECLNHSYRNYFKVLKLCGMTVEIIPQCRQIVIIHRHPSTSGYSSTVVRLNLPWYSK